jgi:hypothetical protein
MNQSKKHSHQANLPSTAKLIKATLLAAAVAVMLLITTVLPAEYGYDPTGVGAALGLTALQAADAPPGNQQPSSSNLLTVQASPVHRRNNNLRSDSMSLALRPGQGAEIKAHMKAGENFVFNWEADGGLVHFDLHGERINDGNAFTSFWQGRDQANANGSFTAPFDGTHGWYWQNSGQTPVTINLKISGFYADLYKP